MRKNKIKISIHSSLLEIGEIKSIILTEDNVLIEYPMNSYIIFSRGKEQK
jgi:hypothetical protein